MLLIFNVGSVGGILANASFSSEDVELDNLAMTYFPVRISYGIEGMYFSGLFYSSAETKQDIYMWKGNQVVTLTRSRSTPNDSYENTWHASEQNITDKQDKTDNALQTSAKTIVGAINELWNRFTDYVKGIKHITYAQLKSMRDTGTLVAGQWYRITDYVTTVANDTEARSAGHVFDILVFATSQNTLSEEAKAIKSARDTDNYFADSNLDAWKIWYSLDNDVTRFAWADAENGTGVIYRMIDEWQNDCPYDFKNVQYKRYKVIDTSPNGELCDLNETYIGTNSEMQNLLVEDEEDYLFMYTFSLGDRLSSPIDASLVGYTTMEFGEGYGYKGFYGDNIIMPCTCHKTIDSEQQSVFCLNNIVWVTNNVRYRSLINGTRIDSECINMTLSEHGTHIQHDCQNIIMGDGCLGNTIGVGCSKNTFGNSCGSNTFGNSCYENTFGNGCSWNTFGNYFQNNTFGNDCNGNTFGNYFQNNTFGNGCSWNTFGNSCGSNTFGNNCNGNTFGNYFQNNTFGNSCGSNTFGNSCGSNTFGNNVRQLTIFEGVQYVSVTGIESDSSYIQNAQILNGTRGENSSNMLQISFQEDAQFCQIAGLKSDGSLRIWNPADGA